MRIPRRTTLALPTLALLPQGAHRAASAQTATPGIVDGVRNQFARIGALRLDSSVTIPDVTLAYETYGTLNAAGDNAVLMTHGFTNSHHAAGRYAPGGAPPGISEQAPGSWDLMIGAGKPIDPARFFVVSSNMLGGCYGSTGPSSINPATGRQWGPDFPHITLRDIVTAQRALLEGLGVRRLAAVMGTSYGGFQAFTWATHFPDMMKGAIAVNTAPRGSGNEAEVQAQIDALARDPNWNGGRYYDNGGIPGVLTDIRVATLLRYGIEAQLRENFPEPAARQAEIRRLAGNWARNHDGNTMVTLRRAMVRFHTEPDFPRIRAKILYALTTTDLLFPPAIAPPVMAKLREANVDATFFEIMNDRGHIGANVDSPNWVPTLRTFLARATA